METALLLKALLIGLVEGLTEFLPISSTGHIILLEDLIGFDGPPGKVFEIVIQLGAILAVCVVKWRKLVDTLFGLFREPVATRFALNVVIAFLPAAIVGVFAKTAITTYLFNPWTVSIALIVGGVAILAIENYVGEGKVREVDDFSLSLALKIGCFQVISMFPGVSRSGATIMGARILGVQRAAATEFSFFLAIPTMLGASVYSAYKSAGELSGSNWTLIGIGFVAAFLAALVVVRGLFAFISRHGFGPFAWYRIALGFLMLGFLIAR